MRALIVGLVMALALTWANRSAAATPSRELAEARSTFRAGNFGEAIAVLSALLYPQSRLSDSGELVEAHLLLGLAFFETGKHDSASREIEAALFLDSDLSIDAALFSEEAVQLVESKKAELERRARDDGARARRARTEAALEAKLDNLAVLEKRSYYLNFIPFGTGQFQNGQRRKGLAFAVAQGALGATSVALYSYQVLKYGFAGTVPKDEVDQVFAIQVVQVASGTACIGVIVWGIIDSLAHYEPSIRRELDPATREELRKLYREDGESSRPAAAAHRPRLLPGLGPDFAGASLLWEF